MTCMTPKKSQKKQLTVWQIAKDYMQRFVAHRALVKRALFKWPKRIVQDAYTHIDIVDKIKTFFGRTWGSIWLLIASGLFLLYAAWSAFWPKTMTIVSLHPAADAAPDIATPVQNPIISNPTTDDTDSPATTQEPSIADSLIVTSTPVVADTIQHIYTMYDAINNGSYTPSDYFDSYMQTSDLVKTYFNTKRLTTLRAAIDGDITVASAEEFATDRRDRIGVRYDLTYTLINQSFTETRSVTLRPQWEWWKIGTIRCETRWCSINPFFNIERYGIK